MPLDNSDNDIKKSNARNQGSTSKRKPTFAAALLFLLGSVARGADAALRSNNTAVESSSALDRTNSTTASGLPEGPFDSLVTDTRRRPKRRTAAPTSKPTTRGRPTAPTRKRATSVPTRKRATSNPTTPTRVTKKPTVRSTAAPTVFTIPKPPLNSGFSTDIADFHSYSIPPRGTKESMAVQLLGPQGNPYTKNLGQEDDVIFGPRIPLSNNIELGVIIGNAKVTAIRYYNQKGEWVQYNYIAPPAKLPIDPAEPHNIGDVGVYRTCSFLSGMERADTNALFLHSALQAGLNPRRGFQDKRPGVIIAKISTSGVERPFPWGFGNPRLFKDLGYDGGKTYDFNVGHAEQMQWKTPSLYGDPHAFNGQLREFERKMRDFFDGPVSVAIGSNPRATVSFTVAKRKLTRRFTI